MSVEPEGFHVFQFFAPDAPETAAALAQIADFVRQHTGVVPGVARI